MNEKRSMLSLSVRVIWIITFNECKVSIRCQPQRQKDALVACTQALNCCKAIALTLASLEYINMVQMVKYILTFCIHSILRSDSLAFTCVYHWTKYSERNNFSRLANWIAFFLIHIWHKKQHKIFFDRWWF